MLQLLGLVGDSARFLFSVPHALHSDLFAGVAFGPQRLAEAALVGGDEPRRRTVCGRRAVIAFEANDFGAGKIALETQNVFDLRAAPAIDRLIVVAHAADIFEPAPAAPLVRAISATDTGRHWCPDIRRPACSGSARIFGEDFRVLAEQQDVLEQQIAEIGGVQRFSAAADIAL